MVADFCGYHLVEPGIKVVVCEELKVTFTEPLTDEALSADRVPGTLVLVTEPVGKALRMRTFFAVSFEVL